jgi:hypothetical protein
VLFDERPAAANAVAHSLDGAVRATRLPQVRIGVADWWMSQRAAIARVKRRDEDGLVPAMYFKRVCIDGPRGAVALTAW